VLDYDEVIVGLTAQHFENKQNGLIKDLQFIIGRMA
jgi:hypothetical protein